MEKGKSGDNDTKIRVEPDAPPGFFERFRKERAKAEAGKGIRRANDQKPGLGNYMRIMKYGKGFDRGLQIVGCMASLISGAVFPVMTVFFGQVVDNFSEYFQEGSNITMEEFRRRINALSFIFVYLFLGKLLMGYISMVCFRYTAARISTLIRQAYLRAVFSQDLTFFDKLKDETIPQPQLDLLKEQDLLPPANNNGSPGTIAICITTITSLIQGGIGEKVGGILQALAQMICGFSIAFSRHSKLAAVCSTILPAIALVQAVCLPALVKLEHRIVTQDARAADVAEEVLASIRTTQSLNAHHRAEEQYQKIVDTAKSFGVKKAIAEACSTGLTFFVMFASYSLCFFYGVRLFRDGGIQNPGVIVTVYFAVAFGASGIIGLTTPMTAIFRASASSGLIFKTIDRKPLIDALSTEGRNPDDLPSGDLALNNVKFSYPETGKREAVHVLGGTRDKAGGNLGEGLSLKFTAGKTTALVGKSGCGKSSIVALLERWYDPQEGSITISHVDIKSLNLRQWRSQIGLVIQEPYLFSGTIYFNISKGLVGTQWENESEDVKRKMVIEACEQANAVGFIDSLPKRYDTEVGNHGLKLSGGQKQRIAIARSIIANPKILILDEATSAVDPKNERIVQNALEKISEGRTTILIAHRLSTVKNADNIVVLDSGNIVESGTHQELLAHPEGAYKQLIDAQSLLLGEDSESSHKLVISDSIHQNFEEVIEVNPVIMSTEEKIERLAGCKAISKVLWEQRRHWILLVLGVIGTIGAGACIPVGSVFFALVMGTFTFIGDLDAFVQQGYHWSTAYLILAVGVGACRFLMSWMFQLISCNAGNHYRREYFHNIVRQRIPFFDKERNTAGALTSHTSHDPVAIQDLLGMAVGFAVMSVVTLVGSCTLSLVLGWKMAIVCICSVVPLLIVAGYVRIKIEMGFVKDTMKVFGDSAAFATEAVGAYRTVSSLVMEEDIRSRYADMLDSHVKRILKRTLYSSILYSASESLTILATALCFWYGGKLMANGEYGMFQFFIVYMTVIQGSEAAGNFFGLTPNVATAIRSIKRMFKLRENHPEPGDKMDENSRGGYEIEFKDVSFGYPERGNSLFNGLNLKIEKGQFAAIVGASGCGKSTLISILERFYDVNGGRVLIDGKDITSFDMESYRDCVSLVAQEPVLYQGTVSYNIKLGTSDDKPESSVIQACKEAYIHDFITSLPEGYNTVCGSKGIGLSGGQKQRVAIARALIRDPKLLLLDEATASLDTKSEKMVQKAFENAAEGRTMVVVAHRLSTIQKADVIFVLDEGRIVEQGDHASLVKKRGVYWQMCLAQLLDN
ncbi:P-loop containing nucleoside triphosphate hydrolase protein [Choiromyces venosus 120613-1]|uniref:P-loop containing nucleoside triphosphate hydrolase protein n=1 Tax=Choiromyces venosus 120613-1 TaxID=1336337 RepID=A0A3N4JLM9_9PEZI|nr:P-loop containing nucleoside triphosphate hydrolase protein [Choiromyces venosus 120613-1]